MTQIYKCAVGIRNAAGVPLIPSKYTPRPIDALDRTGKTKGKARRAKVPVALPPETLYRAHVDAQGEHFIPRIQLLLALQEAGTFVIYKKKALTDRRTGQGVVLSAITLLPEDMILKDPQTGGPVQWSVKYMWSCRRPFTGLASCLRYSNWCGQFSFLLDTGIFDLDTAKLLIEVCGAAVGLGAMRAGKGGEYGKFEVITFEAVPYCETIDAAGDLAVAAG